jgi:Na+-transporting methylmalonyl-CoA/oxaloacetate decarboxylase gamma subunit
MKKMLSLLVMLVFCISMFANKSNTSIAEEYDTIIDMVQKASDNEENESGDRGNNASDNEENESGDRGNN